MNGRADTRPVCARAEAENAEGLRDSGAYAEVDLHGASQGHRARQEALGDFRNPPDQIGEVDRHEWSNDQERDHEPGQPKVDDPHGNDDFHNHKKPDEERRCAHESLSPLSLIHGGSLGRSTNGFREQVVEHHVPVLASDGASTEKGHFP
jgi:hypothetical protein